MKDSADVFEPEQYKSTYYFCYKTMDEIELIIIIIIIIIRFFRKFRLLAGGR